MIILEDILKKYESNQKVNFDHEMLQMIKVWQELNKRPRIILHSCCAPCSTYVLEEMTKHADITIFFSNSNIHPKAEYERRAHVQKVFIEQFNQNNQTEVSFVEDLYQPQVFIKKVFEDDLQGEKEGGLRCDMCFQMRLDRVAEYAKQHNYDYFGSALTLSPHKNSQTINRIGYEVQMIYQVDFLPSDFKKRGGYKRSIEMSEQYQIYRQCYCGCAFAAAQQGVDLKSIQCDAVNYLKNALKDIK